MIKANYYAFAIVQFFLQILHLPFALVCPIHFVQPNVPQFSHLTHTFDPLLYFHNFYMALLFYMLS